MVTIWDLVYMAKSEDDLVHSTMIVSAVFFMYFAFDAVRRFILSLHWLFHCWKCCCFRQVLQENRLELICFVIARTSLSLYVVLTLIEDLYNRLDRKSVV